MWVYIIIGVIIVSFAVWFVYHQRMLRLRAHLMQEAIRNKDFTFRRGGIVGTAHPCADP